MNGDKGEWIVKLTERINGLTSKLDDQELVIGVLKTEIGILKHTVNNLEVLLDNLRCEYKVHTHTAVEKIG